MDLSVGVERNLPMRCLGYVSIVCLLAGCRSQAVPVTNPFMGPAVVPAPATRAPAPGTAAPYYPGDALPGSVPAGAPAPVTPPAASPYGAPPATYGVPPTAAPPATNPPGGWNSYPPVSQSTNGNVRPVSAETPLGPAESVQVPTDNGSLRFTPQQTDLAPVTPTTPTPVVPDTRVAPVQFVNQTPVTDQRPVVLREITSEQASDYRARPTGPDGFRPQGSSRTAREQNRFSTPVESSAQETPTTAPVKEVADRFGFDPHYSWLRGQLEQSPATGQWQLRYVPHQGTVDQYGGRISIANPQVLGDLQNGDYVAVQGQLQMLQLGSGANVPTYAITVLQRQQFEAR